MLRQEQLRLPMQGQAQRRAQQQEPRRLPGLDGMNRHASASRGGLDAEPEGSVAGESRIHEDGEPEEARQELRQGLGRLRATNLAERP